MLSRKYLLIILLFVLCKNLSGCSCGNTFIDINHINSKDFWVKGIVVEKNVEVISSTERLYKFRVELEEVIKGEIKSRIIDVFSRIQDSECGVNFEISDEPIYFFLLKYGDNFQTDLCSNNLYEKYIDSYYLKLIDDFKKGGYRDWKDRMGNTIAVGRINEGYPIGIWEERYLSFVNRKDIGRYKNGKRQGIWKLYNLNHLTTCKRVKYKKGIVLKK